MLTLYRAVFSVQSNKFSVDQAVFILETFKLSTNKELKMEEKTLKYRRGEKSDTEEDEGNASKLYHVSDSNDDSDFGIDCKLCHKEFADVKMYEQHLNSKKHYKMMSKKKLMQKIKKSDKSNLKASNDIETESTDEIFCEVCSKSFSGYIPYATHVKGNVHFKNLRVQRMKEAMKDMSEVIGKDDVANGSDDDDVLQKLFASCSPCQKVFYDPQTLQNHLKGATHKKTLRKEKIVESLKNQLPQNAEGSDVDKELFTMCELCKKSFTGPVPFKVHLISSAHKKELKRSEAEEALTDYFTRDPESRQLICKECGKAFPDPFALKIHLDGKSHEKRNAKYKMLSFATSHPEIVVAKSIQNYYLDEEKEGDDETYNIGCSSLVCKLCHMSFSGPENAEAHVKSKKHFQLKVGNTVKESLLRKRKDTKDDDKSDGACGSNPVGNSTDINETSSAINPSNGHFKCTSV